jgi:hypothetical protein
MHANEDLLDSWHTFSFPFAAIFSLQLLCMQAFWIFFYLLKRTGGGFYTQTHQICADRQTERKRCFDFGLLTDDQSSPDWNLCLSWGLGIVVNFKLTNLLLLAYCRYCYMYIWRKFRVSNIHNPSLSILDIKNPWKKSMGQALEMNWGLGEPPKHIPQVHGWVTN